MRVLKLRTAAVVIAAGLGLGACAYNPYGGIGVGYGDPYYDGYGYGQSGYGYDRYGYGYDRYDRYGRGYSPYYGWYNDAYYPGTGYYVYDPYGRSRYWSDYERRYWEDQLRRHRAQNPQPQVEANWRDFVRGRVVNVNDIQIRNPDGTINTGAQQVIRQRVRAGGERRSNVDVIRQRVERRQSETSSDRREPSRTTPGSLRERIQQKVDQRRQARDQ